MATPGANESIKAYKTDSKPKMIMDAVHGLIEIPPHCVDIMDTPQFQRLRFVKQLGAVFLVYPSAAHSRFEHSLGVCHLASRMVNELRRRQPELGIDNRDVMCVEIAGLCHDLGHGAYSHLFEKLAKGFKHEDMSCKMFDHLLEDNGLRFPNEDVEFIKDLIVGKYSNKEACGRGEEKKFLFEIVNNDRTGVDVDKWDYFLRDGLGLGIKVTFDYERLIRFSKVYLVEGEKHICFHEKEIENLYEMNHARTMLHKRAYQHRVVKIIECMLVDALKKASEFEFMKYPGEKPSVKLSKVHEDLSAFALLTDDIIQQIRLETSTEKDLEEAKTILNKIFSRNFYKYVGELSLTDNITEEQLKEHIDDLEKKCDCECLKKSVKFGSKDGTALERQYLYVRKNSNNECFTLKQDEVSRMLPKEYEDLKYYVIVKDDDKFEEVQREFRDLKERLNGERQIRE